MNTSYDFDSARFTLGPLCKRGHDWTGAGLSLRYAKSRGCVECAKQKSRQQVILGKHAKAHAVRRQRDGRPSRAIGANGKVLPVGIGKTTVDFSVLARGVSPNDLVQSVQEHRNLWSAIRKCGQMPSVAKLVELEQKRYAKEAEKQLRKERFKKRYLNDPDFRLYHRQKSKRRKALLRGSIGIHYSGRQVSDRFQEFGNCCAYCGKTGDLHIEHVIPISKGGTHVISNVIPACPACNYSKRDSEVETWYRMQSFFSQKRWRMILRAIGVRNGPVAQLALL